MAQRAGAAEGVPGAALLFSEGVEGQPASGAAGIQ